MNKYKYLIKNTGILVISNFSSKILIFLMVPLYTSVLSTAEYGLYDIVVSTVQLAFPIITANVVDAVMRFSMDKFYDISKVISIGVRILLTSTLFVAFFLLCTIKSGLFKETPNVEVFILLYYFFYSTHQFLQQFAKGLEHVTDMGIAGILSTIIMVSANIAFLLIFNQGLMGFFAANILAQTAPVVYYVIRLKVWKYIRPHHIDKGLQKEMLRYSIPLIFSTIGWWVNNAANRYFVIFFINVAANGLLSVAYKIPSIINVVQSIFVQAWQISAIKEFNTRGSEQFYGIFFMYLNMLMCFCCSILIMLSKPIASVLYAEDFYAAWEYVPLLLVASVVNSASGVLGPILSADKNSKDMAKSAIFGIVMNLVGNAVLIPFFGLQGAPIAALFSSIVIYMVRKKAVGSKMELLEGWKVYVCWGILVLQAIAEIISLNILLEICAIFFLIIFLRKYLKKFFLNIVVMFKKK